ncbi:MAG: hypothetical protein A4S09_02875 [Proteobacteria bacterium SG_bin7]|nr:MAG: hypothetical protein A4S09_02875 [Proteobacteria bacterium SG_bin7]
MTGFGEVSHLGENLQVSVTVRAVNGRHLEIRPHLPKEYLSLETDVKKIIQNNVGRATVDIFVSRKVISGKKNFRATINKDMAIGVFKSYEQLRKYMKIKEEVSLTHLLRWPEIINFEIDQKLLKGESETLLRLVKKAIADCNEQRKREGRALAEELKRILNLLFELVQKMEPLAIPNQEQSRQTLMQRWEKLKGPAIDENRLAQEVVIFVDRYDVTEELARLHEHIAACLELLKSESVAGKKLEFFSQELLREVNTIGSKAQKSDLTRLVVEAKGCIERMREQVQNVE